MPLKATKRSSLRDGRVHTTRDLAIYLRKKRPEWRLEDIAIRCGVSPQRIFNLFRRYNLSARRISPKETRKCSYCGKTLLREITSRFCNKDCHSNYQYFKVPCKICGTEKTITRSLYLITLRSHRWIACTEACKRLTQINFW